MRPWRARNAAKVPAACGAIIAFAGCSAQKPPPLPHFYVRIDALAPLHPAYANLPPLEKNLWQEQRAVDNTSVRPVPAIATMPPDFDPPQGLPADRVKEHEATVHDDAARYISQLEVALAERDKVQIAARRTAETQLADAEYAEALNKKTVELRDIAVVEARGIQRELDRLSYRAEALASQMRVYSGSGFNTRRLQEDVRIQQVEVDRRIQEKSAAVAGLLKGDFKGLAAEALKPLKRQLEAQASANVQTLAEQLAAASKQEAAEARKRLDEQPSAIEQLTDARNSSAIKGSPRTSTSLNAPNLNPGTAMHSADSRLGAEENRAQSEARKRLREMIIADTVQCVERVARQEGWIPEFAKKGKLSDRTNRLSVELRKFWNLEVPKNAVSRQ